MTDFEPRLLSIILVALAALSVYVAIKINNRP